MSAKSIVKYVSSEDTDTLVEKIVDQCDVSNIIRSYNLLRQYCRRNAKYYAKLIKYEMMEELDMPHGDIVLNLPCKFTLEYRGVPITGRKVCLFHLERILDTLVELNTERVQHYDIKPNNILTTCVTDKEQYSLIDFEFMCRSVWGNEYATEAHDTGYVFWPVESCVVSKTVTIQNYNRLVDLYSKVYPNIFTHATEDEIATINEQRLTSAQTIDVWGFGVTLLSIDNDGPFSGIAKRCIHKIPAMRPTMFELRTLYLEVKI